MHNVRIENEIKTLKHIPHSDKANHMTSENITDYYLPQILYTQLLPDEGGFPFHQQAHQMSSPLLDKYQKCHEKRKPRFTNLTSLFVNSAFITVLSDFFFLKRKQERMNERMVKMLFLASVSAE